MRLKAGCRLGLAGARVSWTVPTYRFHSPSLTEGSIFSSVGNSGRDTGQELTTEEILEFAQLIGSFSRSADDTAAALNVLAPLLDERYILPKAANTGMAVIGTVAAVAVTFFWWNPMGWTAGALGTAAL